MLSRLFAPTCTDCKGKITGRRSFAYARPYHPECLDLESRDSIDE